MGELGARRRTTSATRSTPTGSIPTARLCGRARARCWRSASTATGPGCPAIACLIAVSVIAGEPEKKERKKGERPTAEQMFKNLGGEDGKLTKDNFFKAADGPEQHVLAQAADASADDVSRHRRHRPPADVEIVRGLVSGSGECRLHERSSKSCSSAKKGPPLTIRPEEQIVFSVAVDIRWDEDAPAVEASFLDPA